MRTGEYLLFNESTCKCLHIGHANGIGTYEIHNTGKTKPGGWNSLKDYRPDFHKN